MKRILLRSGKDPFEIASPETTLEANLIADNSGNLVFMEAAHKILSAPGVEVVADHRAISPRDAARINAEYDAYVIPLANAFRLTFEPLLDRLTQVIERLRIPVVILGVGAQGTIDYDTQRLKPIERSVRAFARAVLDRSPSIGVRGELTRDYLQGLGFRDVEVIGCPSMFLWGENLRVEKRVPHLGHDARVVLNVSPYVKAMGSVVMANVERYPNLTYVAQDIATLQMLVWGESAKAAATQSRVPVHGSHPLFAERRTRLYLDPWPWIRDLREADFSFGTRIHGNIAALLAGTPAFVFAHDSRTLELARYFGIPHRAMRDVPADVDPADLYAEADFTALNDGHPARLATFLDYLSRNGLDNIFAHDGASEAFDSRMASTAYPPAVGTDARSRAGSLGARARRRRFLAREALRAHGRRLRSAILPR
jgi:Polysaccharide pyruvyl transferase